MIIFMALLVLLLIIIVESIFGGVINMELYVLAGIMATVGFYGVLCAYYGTTNYGEIARRLL